MDRAIATPANDTSPPTLPHAALRINGTAPARVDPVDQARGAAGRIEAALEAALSGDASGNGPPTIIEAMRHAVFPAGARVRPRLCLAVAASCGVPDEEMADGAAAAIELLHCASLVHDDMPCFDDAATRRGRPSVHAAYGESLALLVGDALIIAAYDALARGGAVRPDRLPLLMRAISAAVGATRGIIAGQAWEVEDDIPLERYHRAKTSALFVGATACGAIAAGTDPEPWRRLGERLGDAYQIADDLRDAVLSEAELGKPAGQDDRHGRPSAVAMHGVDGALRQLRAIIAEAVESIPECPGRPTLERLVLGEAKRLTPPSLAPVPA